MVAKTKRKKLNYSNKSALLEGNYSEYRKKIRRRGLLSSRNAARIYKLPFGRITVYGSIWKNLFTIFVAITGLTVVISGFILMVFLQKVSAEMPDADSIRQIDFAETTKIYDRNMNLLYTNYTDENREYVSLDRIPEHTKWSLLAAEDIDFYEHAGLDFLGLMKAAYIRVKSGEWERGSSTITQQLVKNTSLYELLKEDAYKKTYSRKMKEMLITMKFEQDLSKDEILEYYMNVIPLGGTIYGYQAAAKTYFGKDVSELTLAESATIAGVIQAPGIYSPLFGTDPEYAEVRREYVLDQLSKYTDRTGITLEEIEKARNEELVYKSAIVDIKCPHFVFWVKQQLVEEFGSEVVDKGGLQVVTTIDYSMQQIAEQKVREVLDGVNGAQGARDKYNVHNASLVALNPKTGEVLSMVGSYDYWQRGDPRLDGNVNVSLSPRQMGSAAKPIAYLGDIINGYYPTLLLPDIEMKFGNYKPENWNRKYDGHMLMRDALLASRNIPAIEATELIGANGYVDTSEKLGITTLIDRSNYGLSLGIGAGEMKLLEITSAYGVFANMGVRNDPVSILKVTDKHGNVLREFKQGTNTRVISEQDIYLLNWILCNESDVGRLAKPYYNINGQVVCGKTGTTDGPRDLTTFMYNQNIAIGVWTGNNNNEVTCGIRKANGDCGGSQGWSENTPLPIVSNFFKAIIGNYPGGPNSRPGGIITSSVCIDSGKPADANNPCLKTTGVFISGKVPEKDNGHTIVPICRSNGKIASNETDARAMGLIDDKLLLDISLPSANHDAEWQKYQLEHRDKMASLNGRTADQIIYKFENVDTAECPLGLGENNSPVVTIISPVIDQRYTPGSIVNVQYSVKSLSNIKEGQIYLDNVLMTGGSFSGNPGSVNVTIPSSATEGTKSLKLVLKDNDNRIGESSVNIKIEKTYSISVSISSINSSTASVNVTGIDAKYVSSVEIRIYQNLKQVATVKADSISINNWSAIISSANLSNGNYSAKAYSYAGSQTFVSSSVNFTVP